jgi:hypothetical protein
MRYSNLQNVTPLDMLPQLEDLETSKFSDIQQNYTYPGAAMLPPKEGDRFAKYIRGNHTISQQAGMTPHIQEPRYQQPEYKSIQEENYKAPKEEVLKTFNMPRGTPSCLDVAEHIANCPICSKFYNTDKTIYIIAIIALSIICILLLKKLLDL